MRGLSESFMASLQSGILADIPKAVAADRDLSLDIRENYLNVYYKGHSLLKLSETRRVPHRYRITIDAQFTAGLSLPPELPDAAATSFFVNSIPALKSAIAAYRSRSIELEYEQLIIRANNYEIHNNTDYFIIDRQYTWPNGRCDLVGLYWAWGRNRRSNQSAPLCLFEVKYGLNPDIATLASQLTRYHAALVAHAESVAAEMEHVFRQKLSLGLFRQPPGREAALRTLTVNHDIAAFHFVVLLVDYNPNSRLLKMDELRALPFASQVRVLQAGLALWQQNLPPILPR